MDRSKYVEIGYGAAQGDDSFSVGAEAARQAMAGISNHPLSVVLVFASVQYDLARLLEGIGSIVGDAPVLGTTTAGEICNGSQQGSVVVAAIASPELRVRVGLGRKVSANWEKAVEEAVGSAGIRPYFSSQEADIRTDLKQQGYSVFSVLFSPGNTRHADSHSFEILEALKQRSEGRFPFFGGGSADDWRMEESFVLCGRVAHPDSLLVAVFETRLKFGISFGHGFSPSPNCAVVTKVKGHEVLELDGRIADEVYADLLGWDADALAGKHLTLTTGRPAGMLEPLGQYRINVASYFTPEGGVRFAQPVPEGTSLIIMEASPESLIEAGRETLRKALLNGQIQQPAVALVFSCALRQRILEKRSPEEISGIKNLLPDTPVLGFFSFGEQAVMDAGINCHGNEMIAVLALGAELSASAQAAMENQRVLEIQRQTEQGLRFQADILNAIQDTVLIISKDMKTLWSNHAAREIFGDRPEMFTQPCFSFYKRRDSVCEECPAVKTMADGQVHQAISSSYDKSGNVIWRLSRSYPYYDEAGEITGAIEVVSDYTDRKHHEAQILAERDMASHWADASGLKERLAICLDAAIQASSMDCGGFYLVDETDGSLVLAAHHGLSEPFVAKANRYSADSDHARLVNSGQAAYALHGNLFPHDDPILKQEGLRALGVIPITFKDRAIACMNIASHTRDVIPDRARRSLEGIARYAGSFIGPALQEEEIRQGRQDLDTLINTIQDMLFILDREGRIIGHNATVRRLLGHTADELNGRHVLFVHPEGQHQAALAVLGEMLAGKTDLCLIPLKTKDGLLIPVETRVVPGRWKDQDVIFGISRDMTERKKMEASLEESKERFRFLAENMADIVWTLDRDWKTTYVSPSIQKVLGFTPEERCRQSVEDMMPPESMERATAFFQEELRREKRPDADPERSVNAEMEYYHADGRTVWMENSVKALRDERGEIIGMYGCSRDITERKGLEAERLLLEQSRQQIEKSESLNRMAGAVAHHFNNMLAAVLGNLEMAQMDLPPGMEVAQHIVDAKRATLRAAEMSRLMLTYTGHSQRTARVLDLSETCNRMATLLEKIKPGRVRLLIDCPSPGPLVNADEGQIQQVLTHLVTNAWEAAGDKEGEVRVAVHTSAAPAIPRASGRPAGWKPTAGFYAELQVADTGCGIPSKDISRLMDPFFSTKFTGRGLGLAVVLGIVQAHGGAIQVRSKEGVGSTFEVFLPLADQQRAAGEGVANAAPAASGAKGQVLLVEDEDTVRKVAEVMLRRLGLQVLTAVDGAEAVQIFRENQDRIALVLSDLTMPRMNGWETLNALRHLQPDIPVILASGYDEARVMAGDHAEKPQAFLQKPYEMKTLKETLEKVFGKRTAFGLA